MSYNSNLGYGYHNDNDHNESHLDRIKDFLRQNYAFRKNEILDRLEYKSNEMEEFHVNCYSIIIKLNLHMYITFYSGS